jgi:sugar O-acyltransferase (sialic acid O-acetyltransferase NeuD family)
MCGSFLKPDTLTPHISTGQSTLGDGRSESTTKVAVIGAGGHAKAVISTLRVNGHSIGAIFDDDVSLWKTKILDVPVRGSIATAVREFEVGIVAIGDNATRRKIARSLNLHWLTLTHPAAWVAPEARIGAGTVVFAGAVVQPGSVLGRHVIVNTSASIDHDCIVRDFVHLAPGVHLAGQVHVSEAPWGRIYHTGLYELNGRFVYTGRGLGMVGLPLRFDCPPRAHGDNTGDSLSMEGCLDFGITVAINGRVRTQVGLGINVLPSL